MDPDGKSHQEENEDDPAVGVGLVRFFFPFEHGPEDHSGKQGGHRVNLSLNGGEPECVGPAVGQCANDAGADDGQKMSGLQVTQSRNVLFKNPAGQMDDGQVQEENGECRTEGAHDIHGQSRMFRIGEHREETSEQLENRVSRRVPDFEFVR